MEVETWWRVRWKVSAVPEVVPTEFWADPTEIQAHFAKWYLGFSGRTQAPQKLYTWQDVHPDGPHKCRKNQLLAVRGTGGSSSIWVTRFLVKRPTVGAEAAPFSVP